MGWNIGKKPGGDGRRLGKKVGVGEKICADSSGRERLAVVLKRS